MKTTARIVALICLTISFAPASFAQSSGTDIFKAKCQMCHGPDGLGNTPVGKMLRIPSLKDPKAISASDADLFTQVKMGKNKMPPFGSKLTDAQINAVVDYVRKLQK